MTAASVSSAATPVRGRTRIDRILASAPLVALVVTVFVFYAVEAWSRKTPWIFTDELEWTQISRSIAATGHAAQRGQPVSFKSLYVFLIAPFWLFHSTATGYAAVKYANVVIMTSAAIPTYLLARMLVSKRAAIAAALLAISIPAMAYVTTIIIEVAAYPYYALCSWLVVRGFRSGRQRDLVLGGVAALGGLLVRSPQFATLPASYAIAGFALLVTSERGRALRRNWTRGDTLGAVALLVGVLIVFNRVVLDRYYQWSNVTQFWENRMVDLGLRAVLSLTIGIGLLPVVCGFVALGLPERRSDPAYRAFAAWLAANLVCVGLYTADKAAYLSTVFATLWEERNLIYLAPLLLIATVAVFEAKQIDWRIVTGASAFVTVIVLIKGLQFGFPYFEAPGSVIPALLGDDEGWSRPQERLGLLGLLALGLALLALRRRRGIPQLALLLGLAWMLTGEIANTVGIDNTASAFRTNLPAQLNWVDVADHGQPATYLGQAIIDANGELLTEFWNRSIVHVESLDGTATGPGPYSRPLVVTSSGLLSGLNTQYVVADNGVVLDAREVAAQGKMVLYDNPSRRWHLLDNVAQQYVDGWCPDFCAYTYFKPHQRGTLEVTLSRTAYGGSWPAGKATLEVGTVRITAKGAPTIDHVLDKVHTLVENGKQQTISFQVTTPFRVAMVLSNPIPPTPSDSRSLGAQLGWVFLPAKSG